MRKSFNEIGKEAIKEYRNILATSIQIRKNYSIMMKRLSFVCTPFDVNIVIRFVNNLYIIP